MMAVRCYKVPPRRRDPRPWVDHLQVALSLAAFVALAVIVFYAYLERS